MPGAPLEPLCSCSPLLHRLPPCICARSYTEEPVEGEANEDEDAAAAAAAAALPAPAAAAGAAPEGSSAEAEEIVAAEGKKDK